MGWRDLRTWITQTWFIVVVGFIFRVFLAFTIRGRYYAGEISQGVEMAYYLLYPHRAELISFEFEIGIRSYLGPILFLPWLYLAFLLNLDGSSIFILLRLVMGTISLIAIPFCRNLFDDDTQGSKIASLSASWIWAIYPPFVYMSTWITTDMVAMVLVVILLTQIPGLENKSSLRQVLVGTILGITFSLRYPLILIGFPYILYLLFNRRLKVLGVLMLGFVVGLIPLILVDWYFYGIPLFSTWKFFEFNIVQNNAARFGSQPWWFYIVGGGVLVFVGGLAIPPVLYGLKRGYSTLKEHNYHYILGGAVLYLLVFQLLQHKELRFILPALVVIFLLSCAGYKDLYHHLFESRTWRLIIALAIIFSLISVAFLPYQKHGNLWSAQSYIQENAPESSVYIDAPEHWTAKYVMHCGGAPDCGQIWFQTSLNDSLDLDQILASVDYVILLREFGYYDTLPGQMSARCGAAALLEVFDSGWQQSLQLNQDLQNFYGVYTVEVWAC